MDLQTFEKLVKAKKLPRPLCIFAGPEAFLKEKTFGLLAKVYVAPEDTRENVNRIVCTGKELLDLLNLIYSFSFNPSPRLFFIQDIDSATSKQRKDFIEKLKNGGLPAETILVFTTKDAKVATELNSAFKQQAEKIDFWAPFANKLADWVRKEAVELGSEMALDAADQLIELAGSDLALLHQELTKLAIAKPGSRITLADVNKGVAYVRQDNVFDFLEAFGKRQPSKSLRILEALSNKGEAPQMMWVMLCRQLREYRLFLALCTDRPDIFAPLIKLLRNYRLYADKSDFSSNQEKKNIISEIQELTEDIPEVFVNALNLKNQAKIKNLYLALNFSLAELVALWPEIIETDLKLKSGSPDALTSLQLFVAKILCKN